MHNHSFFNIIFDMTFDLHCACLKSYASSRVGAWLFACRIIPFLCLAFDVFNFVFYTRLGFSHFLILRLIHCICGQPLHPTRTFIAPMVGTNCIPWCCLEYLHFHQKRCRVSCFTIANSCPSSTFPLIFSLANWHHIIEWWHLHLGQCVHCQSRSNKFDLTHYFIFWGWQWGWWLRQTKNFTTIGTQWMCFFSLLS